MASQGKINVKTMEVDATMLQKHLYAYQKVLGGTIGQICKRQAALFCQDMISYSRPFSGSRPGDGETTNAHEHGMKNVKNSIYKIFRPIDKTSPTAIADLGDYGIFKMWMREKGSRVSKKKWLKFQNKYYKGNTYKFIDKGASLFEFEEIHSKMRTDNGHGSLKSIARHGNGKKNAPFVIVRDDDQIKKYVKYKQRNVGMLKSAYWWAAVGLGEKIKCPAWAKQSMASRNAISIKTGENSEKPEFTVGNTIGGKAGNDNFVRVAINHRAYSMRVQMAQELMKQKKKLWQACADGRISAIAKGFGF
jgi:hypothetical protein